jgi:hypothetical protein
MPTHHPFTPTELAALDEYQVCDLIGRAAAHFRAYPTSLDAANDEHWYEWYFHPGGGIFRRLYEIFSPTGDTVWMPRYCGVRTELEGAWAGIALELCIDDGDWSYDTGKSCEANARDVLALANEATNIPDEN